jgi:hypothetical protein
MTLRLEPTRPLVPPERNSWSASRPPSSAHQLGLWHHANGLRRWRVSQGRMSTWCRHATTSNDTRSSHLRPSWRNFAEQVASEGWYLPHDWLALAQTRQAKNNYTLRPDLRDRRPGNAEFFQDDGSKPRSAPQRRAVHMQNQKNGSPRWPDRR